MRSTIETKDNELGSINVALGIVGTLIVTLILGSYIYTWTESNIQSSEKVEWRKEHNATLDKRFDEVRTKQDKIETEILSGNTQTALLLQQIIDEQKRSNSNFRGK